MKVVVKKRTKKAATPPEGPAPPPPMYFRCPRKGHVQVEEFSQRFINNETGETVLDTGPLCRECWIADQVKRFATHRIAPPKEGPAS